MQKQAAPATESPLAAQPSGQQYKIFQAQQKELRSQMDQVQEQRNDLAQSLDGKSGADRSGIEARITGLDQRLVQIDADLTRVGKELAASAPASLVDTPRPDYTPYGEDDMWGAGFGGAAIMFAIFLPFIIRNRFRRRRDKAQGVTTPLPVAAADPRIDRMEQAIDTIAVEIERVSENQRFMTRLITETQLAGTIAAVRGSAEAAKLAADPSSNVP